MTTQFNGTEFVTIGAQACRDTPKMKLIGRRQARRERRANRAI